MEEGEGLGWEVMVRLLLDGRFKERKSIPLYQGKPTYNPDNCVFWFYVNKFQVTKSGIYKFQLCAPGCWYNIPPTKHLRSAAMNFRTSLEKELRFLGRMRAVTWGLHVGPNDGSGLVVDYAGGNTTATSLTTFGVTLNFSIKPRLRG